MSHLKLAKRIIRVLFFGKIQDSILKSKNRFCISQFTKRFKNGFFTVSGFTKRFLNGLKSRVSCNHGYVYAETVKSLK